MKTIYRRGAVATVLVTLIGVSIAATSWPGVGQGVTGSSSSSSSPTFTPRVPPVTAGAPSAGQPTTVPSAGVSNQVVGDPTTFVGKVRYLNGVVVDVTKIKRTTLGKATKTKATGVKKGAAIQVLSLRVTNRSQTPLPVAEINQVMTYGPKKKEAAPVRNKSWKLPTALLKPGKTVTGTIGFAVPKKYINATSLSYRFNLDHGPAVFSGSLDYSPGTSATFNDPTGPKAEQLAIIRHIEKSIKSTPAGGTIRIAHYAFDIRSSAKALLAAHKRGVNVQMIVDQHEGFVSSESRSLIRALGHNRKKKNFLIRCKASCMSSRTSAMHAKFYLFTSVGSSKPVAMISSSNLTHTNSRNSWNDIQTVVGDQVLYDSLKKYFKDMLPDKNRPNYFRTTTSGQYKLYFYPRSRRHGGDKPSLMNTLNTIRCSGAAPGYGDKDGHTIVRVTMYSWTSSRIDIARKLWRLHNAGCRVQVIYNSGRTTPPIERTLRRWSSKHGRLDLHDAWRDRNLNDQPERYMHEKALAINGVANGKKSTKVIYAGSQNYTPNATLDNNELIFRNTDDRIYDLYAENFKDMRAHTRKR